MSTLLVHNLKSFVPEQGYLFVSAYKIALSLNAAWQKFKLRHQQMMVHDQGA